MKRSKLLMKKASSASDAMVPKSTKKDFHAEDAMDQAPSTISSTKTY